MKQILIAGALALQMGTLACKDVDTSEKTTIFFIVLYNYQSLCSSKVMSSRSLSQRPTNWTMQQHLERVAN